MLLLAPGEGGAGDQEETSSCEMMFVMILYFSRRFTSSSAHSLQEGNERHESFIVSGLTELLHQGLCLLLGQLLSEVGQETEQFVGKHGVVVILVVKLQDLNKVVETSLVLAVLAGLVHGEDIVLGQHLLSLGLGSSDLSDGLEGGVEVAGSDEV